MNRRILAFAPSPPLAIVLAAMLWGSDLLLRKPLTDAGWAPARLVLAEHLLLLLCFAVPLWRGRAVLQTLRAKDWAMVLVIGWGGSALGTWLYTEAFLLGSPLSAILLQKTQPVFAIVLAALFLGERRHPIYWVWCVLALVGAILIADLPLGLALGQARLQATLCALGAAALWGGSTVAGRWLTGKLMPSLLAGIRFLVAVPLLAVLAVFSPSGHSSGAISHTLWGLLLLIVLLPDLCGMLLYYWGLRRTSASVATLAELCYPLTALVIGIGLQHAVLTRTQIGGLGLLLVSVVALSRAPDLVRTTPEEKSLEPVAV